MTAAGAIAMSWLIWLLSWIIGAGWSARTAAHSDLGKESPARVLGLAGIIMLIVAYAMPLIGGLVWATPAGLGWVLFGVALVAFVFTWAARLHLGPLWSNTAAPTEDHRIVDTGPYGVVRHPVYAGVLLAVWATAVEMGRIDALAGAALITVSLSMRARLEERALRRDISDEAYSAYRARVPMLIPFAKFRAR